MNCVLITTTDSIENSNIQKYIQLVSTNVVLSTNLFADFGASVTDFFGGHSDTYQKKLQNIYYTAINNLKLNATKLGANAVIGLRIEFDEIAGKGKSMFMVSAIGMAVQIDFENTDKIDPELLTTSIPLSLLNNETNKRIIIDQFTNNILPNREQWQYLLNNPMLELNNNIFNAYLESFKLSENNITEGYLLIKENITNYFKLFDSKELSDLLYDNISKSPARIWNLINELKLFSPKKVIELIESGQTKIAIDFLKIDKNYYTKQDLGPMKIIVDFLNDLKDIGKIEIKKVNFLLREEEKYICPNNHINNIEDKFCKDPSCGLNIKGLTRTQDQIIREFKIKTASLESLLQN